MASLTIDTVSVAEVALLLAIQTSVSWLTFTLDRLSHKWLSSEVLSAVIMAAINWCVTIVAVSFLH